MEEYDAEILSIPTESSWSITGSLLEGFEGPVYRFIPGFTRGEGLFMAVLQKVDSGEWKVESYDYHARHESNHNCPLSTIHSKQKVLTSNLPEGDHPQIGLSYQDALKYLRGEALILPADTPRGIVTVTYKGFALGEVKNIGNRANNLYPKPWRIKTTHLPTEEIKIIDI